MRRHLLASIAAALVALGIPLAAQREADAALLQKIRAEATERSRVMTAFDHFVTVIGPRLTGTPEYKAAADWARQTLESWGLSNARLETWEFGRGWVLDRLVVELVEPRYLPLNGYAEAWAASTPGELVAAPIFLGDKTGQEVDRKSVV